MNYQYRIDKEKRKWFIFEPFMQETLSIVNRKSGEEYLAKELDLEELSNAIVDIYEAIPFKDDREEFNPIKFYSQKTDLGTKAVLRLCECLANQRQKISSLDSHVQFQKSNLKAIRNLTY